MADGKVDLLMELRLIKQLVPVLLPFVTPILKSTLVLPQGKMQ